MPKFKIIRIYKYTEELVIESSDKWQALAESQDVEFDRNHDDMLYEEKIFEVEND